MKKIIGLVGITTAFLLSGCNTTSSSKDVHPIPTSSARFENKTCSELEVRKMKLDKLEQRLVKDQDTRYVLSTGMVWTLGVGLGDGDNVTKLGMVRGEKRTIKKVMAKKGCEIPPDPVEETPQETYELPDKGTEVTNE